MERERVASLEAEKGRLLSLIAENRGQVHVLDCGQKR